MEKDFDKWNVAKKEINQLKTGVFFHEREIWWCSLGVNIGYEQNGRNDTFERPILIIKKFNNDIFVGLSITTQSKDGEYYYNIKYKERVYSVILSQVRLLDKRRLRRKIRVLPKTDYKNIIERFKNFFS